VLRFFFSQRRRNGDLTRREWLRVGGFAGLGLPLLGRAAARSTVGPTPGFGRARSVIFVYTSGGMSQIDTWDPKPAAPAEIRGEFASIPTAVPGTRFGEHLPKLARLADRYTLLRSLSHDDADHGSATYLALTGHPHIQKSSNPPIRPSDFPTYGAVLHRVRPTHEFPYTAVHVNGPAQVPVIQAPGQFGGFLGRVHEPLLLGDVHEDSLPLRGLEPTPDLPADRLAERRSLADQLDRLTGSRAQSAVFRDRAVQVEQAYSLLGDPHCRQAFDLSQEPEKVRDWYGRYRSGQACLLARRLAEAGVPWITVIWNHTNRGQDQAPDETDAYGWDTHNDVFVALRERLLPRFDHSFSALLEDLDQRGLLDRVLVVCVGEFGRAPRVALEPGFAGSTPGRKHWAAVYSAVLAGAGVARGGLVGSSDRQGAYPGSAPCGPWDLAATMFAALGVDPAGHYHDLDDRPYPITIGKPIGGLYGG
jgi:hypothetical protein